MGERRRSGQLSSRKQSQRTEQQNANRSNPVNTANAICESVCLLIDFIAEYAEGGLFSQRRISRVPVLVGGLLFQLHLILRSGSHSTYRCQWSDTAYVLYHLVNANTPCSHSHSVPGSMLGLFDGPWNSHQGINDCYHLLVAVTSPPISRCCSYRVSAYFRTCVRVS